MGAVVNPFTGKIDFTGTAPSSGGAFTGGTPGSVLFVGGTASSPTFAQDNQNFYFNDTNDRLSIFTTLGSEVLSNGSFTGNANSWTVPAGMAYSSNSVSKTGNGTGALTQTTGAYVGREYLLTYTISNWTVGTVTPSFGGVTGTAVSANGTYSERISTLTSFLFTAVLAFTPSNTARFTIDTISLKPLLGTNNKSNLNIGGLSIEGNWSNGGPGTTRGITVNNDGSNSWTDYRFSGTLRSAIGANSSGGINIYSSGGNGFALYSGNSGLTSNGLYMYATSTAFAHYGHGQFYTGLITGALSSPTSMLQVVGGSAFKVKRVTASQSLDNTATVWLADASTPVCTGTPSAACSSWTNQTDCEKWDAHGGCNWYAGNACSDANGTDSSTCTNGRSGCTWDSTSCSGAGDQISCESQDDAYGGNCFWDPGSNTCPSYTNTTDCNNASPCYATLGGDCSSLSDGGGDGTNCATQPECSYDSGTGTCSGSYFTSCDGDNSTPSCTGTYNTGSCSGTYGAACQGTSTCAGIDDSTNCGLETGCTWVTAINLTLPDGETCPDRMYMIKNDSSTGADVNILPYSGQKVEKQTGGIVLSNYHDAVTLSYFKQTYDCSNYLTEGACSAKVSVGCFVNTGSCSYDTGSNECTGNAVCSAHTGNQLACEAQTYFSSCYGTEIVTKNWYIL